MMMAIAFDARSAVMASARKKNGKTTVQVKAVVSKDGKTLTGFQTGVNAKGQKVKNVEVYDRQ